jgi:hypothetical protein
MVATLKRFCCSECSNSVARLGFYSGKTLTFWLLRYSNGTLSLDLSRPKT